MSTVIFLKGGEGLLVEASREALLAVGRATAKIMGMDLLEQGAKAGTGTNCVDIEIENADEVAAGASAGQTLTFFRDGITVTFYQNVFGESKIRVSGEASEEQLRAMGTEVSNRLAQQFAYHRLVTEMKSRGMNIIEDEVEQDGTVRMRVRVYQG